MSRRTAFAVPRATPPGGRLDSIQLLRAAAVMIVALYHGTVLFRDPLAARWAVPSPLYFGYAGVDLFFVISGFIIMHVTRHGTVDVRAFAWKRAIRILPFYWAVTSVLLLLWLARPGLVPVRGDDPALFVAGSYLLAPMRERPLLGIGWTLQHEAQFYILMAVLLWRGARDRVVPVLLALFAAGVGLRVFVDPDLRWWDGKLLSLYTLQFALGAIAWRINARWTVRRPWLPIAIGVAGFMATAMIVTPLMGADREVPVVTHGAFGLMRAAGYGAGSFLIVLGALALPSRARATRTAPAMRLALAVGDASFMIYLTHNLVLQGLAIGTRRLPQGMATAPLIVIGGMATVIAVGLLAHRWFERPAIAFLERRLLPVLVGHRVDATTLAGQKGRR